MFKKTLILTTIVAISFAGYLIIKIPVFNINKLSKGYVRTTVEADNVKYLTTKKRPDNWVSFRSLPKHVYYSFVVSEDWSFFEHQGVDLRQIYLAVQDHLNGEKLRGASTISQQLVKNLYTQSERSFDRKVFELFTTMYLEKKLTKEKILEIYLNIIEYGDGLYGITDASWFYFKKKPQDLSPKESAFLAMLLPNPKRYSQSFREKQLTEYASKIVNSILHKLKVTKIIDEQIMIEQRTMPLVFEVTNNSDDQQLNEEEEFFDI